MTHPQAYHTSCRQGLSGQPGFQFNAASGGLTRELLQALAAAHAGYHVPRDAPLEPTPEDLATFPVTLRHRPVDGVGSVVSRTAYVGREFRGRNGEPDSGRFGNYFSHIVVGGETSDPFDGLLAIELWDAPHWTITESDGERLHELERLAPGAIDLETTLSALAGARREWLGQVLDAVLAALEDGPRVVLVEPDPRLGAAWVAWVSYALPQELAHRLTFSTYEGQPRYADGLQLCVTSPGCDVAFAPYELGRSVVVLEPVSGPPPAEPRLYGKVLSALAAEGAEPVSALVRTLGGQAGAGRLGALAAARAGRCQLATPDEIPDVLDVLTQIVRSGTAIPAAATAVVPETATGDDAARAWARLHAAARASAAGEARKIVDEALRRLLAWPQPLPQDLPEVPSQTPTAPSLGVLAAWMETLHGPGLADVIRVGRALGLIGCNAALDRQLASVLAGALDDPELRRVFESLASDPAHTALVAEVATALVDRCAGDPGGFALLRELSANRALLHAVHDYAADAPTFAVRSVWERLAVHRAPNHLPKALAALIPLADGELEEHVVRTLFGGSGPAAPADHVALIGAYRGSQVALPLLDFERAYACLANTPLRRHDEVAELALVLGTQPRVKESSGYIAWYVAHNSRTHDIYQWSDWVCAAVAARPALSQERIGELFGLAASRAAAWSGLRERDFVDAVGRLESAFGRHWPAQFGAALARRLERVERNREQVIADIYAEWAYYCPRLNETVLPIALESVGAGQRDAVAKAFTDARLPPHWDQWNERYPPQKKLARLFKRGDT